ncbi:hypothetical protein [Lactobacillus acetotolerans]|uniref:hypothetical protein n=1 Tax=Lactobacillus acetotolerans TaxID=1600 RepID=UPI002FD8DA1E
MTKYQANTKLRAIKLYQKGVDLNQISKELNITNANEIDHWRWLSNCEHRITNQTIFQSTTNN